MGSVFTAEPHSPAKRAHFSWLVCSRCGLIYLNNALTRFCVKHGCNHEENPDYKRQLATLGGQARR